jgi:hypothetical protein
MKITKMWFSIQKLLPDLTYNVRMDTIINLASALILQWDELG